MRLSSSLTVITILGLLLRAPINAQEADKEKQGAQVRVLAAFDIGSSSTKLTVAEVESISNGRNSTTNKIKKILIQSTLPVRLRDDLTRTQTNSLSSEIEQQLIATMKAQKLVAGEFRPIQYIGIGTSVFRSAKNGEEFLERVIKATGVPISIVPQEEEGAIGFSTAVGASKEEANRVISWDSGGGSFQICTSTDDRLEMYGGEFAYLPALELFFANRQLPISRAVNPVTSKEALELIESICEQLPMAPAWVSSSTKKIISFGDMGSIFANAQKATGCSTFTKGQVMQALMENCHKTDKELACFPNPHEVMISLALVYAMMDHCAMPQITYCYSNGGCEGLLVTPKYWE